MPVFVNSRDGRYRLVNRAWEELTGLTRDQAMGRTYKEIFTPAAARKFHLTNHRVTETSGPVVFEEVVPAKGGETYFHTIKFPLRGPDGRIEAVGGFSIDITDRRRAEEALRESEEKYRALMDFAPTAILLSDSQGNLLEANRRAEELFGYSKAELLQMSYDRLHPPERLEAIHKTFAAVVTQSFGAISDTEVLSKDGRRVPVDITGSLIRYAGKAVAQGIFQDISERKQAEAALKDSEQKLRLLAAQLLTIQDRERLRVSRELHDELGQALTVLKLHLVGLEKKLRRDQGELKGRCADLLSYIDGVIDNVRRLSKDLSPSTLEDLGLSSSLNYLVQETCRTNHMGAAVEIDPVDHLFTPEIQTHIYRIFQESLTNVVRHAGASQVGLFVKRQKNQVSFILRDNGKGFNLQQTLFQDAQAKSLGLTIMQERARLAGGSLRLWSKKGKGAVVHLTLPVL
jgi:PAS domain S-box-containing protein